MALSTKTIKRRIKSIGNTKKITKAMEMISAVKMRRAVANDLATRNYSELAWKLLESVAKKSPVTFHALLSKRQVKKIGIILITSNRGLAGGFTTKLLQEVHKFITLNQESNIQAEVILAGKKGRKIYQNFNHTVSAEFEKLDLTTHINQILPMARLIVKDYTEKKYDKVVIAHTHYSSAIRQDPSIKQLLPLTEEQQKSLLEDEENIDQSEPDFIFEPNQRQVLEILLPKLIEMQIYQAILESDASEHSARMMAMQNASEAAGEMIDELNTTFNKARQAAITQEIMEVIGGAAALE
jgi:F-type H+-transporting ATPase subunit gamma